MKDNITKKNKKIYEEKEQDLKRLYTYGTL